MSFLTINGLTIPIARGGQTTPQLVGEFARAFDGNLLCDNRGFKRVWKFKTTAMKQSDAEIVRGILQGNGDIITFDTGIYSSKGMYTYTAGGTIPPVGYTIHSATAADGDPVDEMATGGTFATASKIGAGSVAIEMATTNLCAQNVRTGTDTLGNTTGFTADGGAALASSTDAYWQGSKSLKITTGAAADRGAHADALGFPGDFCGSVYLKGTGNAKVILVSDVFDAAQVNIVLDPNKWQRVIVNLTATLGATSTSLNVWSSDAAGITCYTDGWQIEYINPAANGCATSWTDGARAEGLVNYPIAPLSGKNGCTMSMWMRAFSAQSTLARELLIVEVDAAAWWETFIVAATTTLRTAFTGAHTIDAAGCCDGAWHHIISTLNPNPATGEHFLQLWKDGVSQGYIDHAAAAFDTTSLTYFSVGGWSGAGLRAAGILIDDLHVFPFPCSTALAATLYAGTPTTFGVPDLIAAGDAIQEYGGVSVRSIIENEEYVPLQDVATWRNNMRRLTFRLEEV